MKTSSSNINESGALKTEKVYYKDGKFWFLEGDKWPEEPNEKSFSGDQWKEANARQHYKESITSAIKQAIQFDDQELAMKLVYGKHGHLDNLPMNFYQWRDEYLKEGLYNISPQEVIILDAKVARIYSTGDLHKHMPLTGKVARLVPSSLEKHENPDKKHFDGMLLKELAWKLDREVWAHVPNPSPSEEWSQSKAREETRKLISEYIGNYDELLAKTRQSLPSNQENKTLQQIKDEIGQKHGFEDWTALFHYYESNAHHMVKFCTEAAELYASQFKSNPKSLQGEDQEKQETCHDRSIDCAIHNGWEYCVCDLCRQVKEGQEEICKEVAIKCNSWGIRYASIRLQKEFTITRKLVNG
jgi:hypothetical protein